MYQLKWGERKHISQNVRGGGGFLKELEGRDFGSCTVAFARGLVLGNRLPRPNPQPAAASPNPASTIFSAAASRASCLTHW